MGAPPLDGIRVVETATYMSGPWAGAMLADLGADVVRVEPPGGDPFRRFGRPTATPYSPVWAATNRGKRAVVADLKTPEGVDALLALVDEADVFLANWRPAVAERLGVGDAVLAARNPSLIRLWLSGVGATGPHASEPAFDTVIQARSGLTDAVARGDGFELAVGYPVDKSTALMAAQAALAALVGRARTGEGACIELSMLDAMAYVNLPDLLANRVFVDVEAPARHAHATAQATFPASDGAFVLALVSGRQIKAGCAVCGHPEWAADLFAMDQADMVRTIVERFSPVTATEPVTHWVERFGAEDIPVARCLTIDEHLADAQVAHNELYRIEDWPGVGRVRTVRYPATSDAWGGRLWPPGPAPSV